jgi:striatin 1/3/4
MEIYLSQKTLCNVNVTEIFRAKIYRLTHNGEDPEPDELDEQLKQELESLVPLDVDAVQQTGNPPAWKQARQMLTQYLQEIGYSEKIRDMRSFRVRDMPDRLNSQFNNGESADAFTRSAADKALMDSERAIMKTAEFLKSSRQSPTKAPSDTHFDSDSDNDESQNDKKLDMDAEEALDEFAFLSDENTSKEVRKATNLPKSQSANNDEWNMDQATLDHMKEQYRTEKERKRNSYDNNRSEPYRVRLKDNRAAADSDANASILAEPAKKVPAKDFGDINSALGLGPDDAVDIKDDFAMADDESMSLRWNLRYTLRSHYDSVRGMHFHPVEPLLITAGEDGTAKMWNLNAKVPTEGAKNAQVVPSAVGIVDVEPIYTFRGHKGPILAMDMAPTGELCYTGGYDGTICCWVVPPMNIDIQDPYDPSVLTERFTGHSDIVWAVAFHSSSNRVISASADGTIRLWEPGAADIGQSLVKTFTPPTPDATPRSIDIVSTEPQQLLTAYSKGQAHILDLESGRNVLSFDLNEANVEIGEINRIISHPTMPVTVMAGEDRRIRYFDNNTG